MFRRLDPADGDHPHDAELRFHRTRQAGHLRVVGQEPRELGAGRGRRFAVGGREGGEVFRVVGEEPLQGYPGIESDQLAEAGRQLLVVHGGGVLDRRHVLLHPALETGLAGADALGAVAGLPEDEAGVERRLQVGQAGADAEAGAEGARVEVPDILDVAGAGDAAEGYGGLRGGGRQGFGRGGTSAETGQEEAAAVPGEVDGEGPGEEGGAEDGPRQLGGGGAAEGVGFAGTEAVAGEGNIILCLVSKRFRMVLPN